jgi:hypothetical protein
MKNMQHINRVTVMNTGTIHPEEARKTIDGKMIDKPNFRKHF